MLVECEAEICKKVNKVYIEAKQNHPIDAELLERVVSMLRRKFEYGYEDLALALDMKLATFKYHLGKVLGLTVSELKEALVKEVEEKRSERVKRKEVKVIPPATFDEFISRSVVKEIEERLAVAKITDKQRKKVLSTWFKICKETGIAPEEFFKSEESDKIKKLVEKWIINKVRMGYDQDSLVANVQAVQKWLGVIILPEHIEQSEYTGEFTSAEIPKDIRDKIVSQLLDMYEKTKDKFLLRVISAYCMLYYTGSRAEALKTYSIESEVTFNVPDLINAYNENTFVIVKTLEKGKKGKKYEWQKLVPASYKPVIMLLGKFTDYEIKRLRKIMREQLAQHIDKLNEDTKSYIIDAEKSLHLWRHTSAREFLRALKFNRYLVAKLLGWKKENNLKIYGDYELVELLQAMSIESKIQFVSDEVKKRLLSFFK